MPYNLEQWFNHHAKLLAEQMQPKYNFSGINPQPFLVHKTNIIPHISKGIGKWLASMDDIVYISICDGDEANYIVFLDSGLNKFHETYLADYL